MKACKSCPFSHSARPGLWAAAHYVAIAYLGSANVPELVGTKMGCHQFNGLSNPKIKTADSTCGGWIRAALDTSLSARMLVMSGRADADNRDSVMSPVEMLHAQGIDVDALPPLEWMGPSDEYPEYEGWKDKVLSLRALILKNPFVADQFILEGSPLHDLVSDDELEAIFGKEGAEAYINYTAPVVATN